jgi:ankyrin repeat protein
MNKTTEDEIQNALRRLPTGSEAYDQAYKDAMERIEEQDVDGKRLAKQVLLWTVSARRPLVTAELQHALAVEIGESEFNAKRQPDIEDMVSVCAGLVTIDKESDIFRLVHYTTQQYFERTQSDWFPNAETNITTMCVTYLSFNVFEGGFCQTDDEFEERLRSNQFFEYAARNWGHHARKASTIGQTLRQPVVDFLETKAKVDASSQGLLAIKRYSSHSNYSQKVPRWTTGLHLTAYFGVKGIVKLLLDRGKVAVDSKNDNGQTPLSWAAARGHEAVVKLLLDTGKVDVDSKDTDGRTPLWCAVGKGHEAIVKLLLDTDKVYVDSKDTDGRTPLWCAVEEGHEAIVKLLLDTGKVDVDSKDTDGGTPLWCAVEEGHEAIVKLLLDTGKVDADSKDNYGGTPLSWAAASGREAVVKLLLDTGKVDADSKDNDGGTPLSWAAASGREAIVKLLLDTCKVDADSKDNDGQTPLWWAAASGHEAVVKLLLDTGKVDTDSKDNYGGTLLSWAAAHGNDSIVKLLD